MFWNSLPHHDVSQRSDNLGRTPASLGADHQALPRAFIDQVQDAHTSAMVRSRIYKVVASHTWLECVGLSRTHEPTLSHNRPRGFCLSRYFQPFATPDAFDSVLAYLPAGSLEQRRDPAITIAAILAGKYNDGLSQSIFVFTLRRPVALRASGLPQ